MDIQRDLKGNWGQPDEPSPWPNNAKLAVSFVVNVEEGSELSIREGDERNEPVYEVREEVKDGPDPCMESHFNYGPRRGYQRIMDAFTEHKVKATFSTCGRSAHRLPWLLKNAISNGHEISAHGWRWERHAGMSRDAEEQIIANTYNAIKAASGTAPVGWHTRSASSANTRDLLVQHGGFAYDSDAYDDDMPRIESVNDHEHIILPYAFDTNDMRFSPGGGFIQATDFSNYVIAAFNQLLNEGSTSVRMLSIGLHLRIIGRPARISGLHKILEHISNNPAVWLTTRKDIAACWRDQKGLAPWSPTSDN
ncbi:MAG: peptidoglycan/xylan/chitin deacetylase (PgdA/CDA1 family) [Pseudomonadales bacterium]|jgi:peptidoglycan/xylan/chitin deacetylase (PgdA/CDA1 family)